MLEEEANAHFFLSQTLTFFVRLFFLNSKTRMYEGESKSAGKIRLTALLKVPVRN